jgi:hypothetical protein
MVARKSVRRSPHQSGGKQVGSRASVARGGATETPGGLSLGNGLFRKKDGRIVSKKVSEQAKKRYAKNPALKERAQLVKEAFASVRKAKKAGQKMNTRAIMKNPVDAKSNPTRYLLRA